MKTWMGLHSATIISQITNSCMCLSFRSSRWLRNWFFVALNLTSLWTVPALFDLMARQTAEIFTHSWLLCSAVKSQIKQFFSAHNIVFLVTVFSWNFIVIYCCSHLSSSTLSLMCRVAPGQDSHSSFFQSKSIAPGQTSGKQVGLRADDPQQRTPDSGDRNML